MKYFPELSYVEKILLGAWRMFPPWDTGCFGPRSTTRRAHDPKRKQPILGLAVFWQFS